MGKGSSKKSSSKPQRSQEEKNLGDFKIPFQKFENLSRSFKKFQSKEFQKLNEKQKGGQVNQLLCELIKASKTPCFLLPAVLDYIEQINGIKVLESYAFFHFELWLNQFSHLSSDENYRIRAKIAGKWVPRDEFQILFPIGMGKVYPGSHYVTAHGSPDLDTTIASFWGWLDAFTARVASGLHFWNIPGGAPTSAIEISLLFNEMFGKNVFNYLAKNRTTLALSGIDLMTQKGLIHKQTHESTLNIDHGGEQQAIVLIDRDGYYLGDWRDFDVEGVRQVIVMLNTCLRWLQNHLHKEIISLFAKEKLTLKDLPPFITTVLGIKLEDSHPAQEFTEKQKKYVQEYLVKVLKVNKGLSATFEEFAKAMKKISLFDFQGFVDLIEKMPKSALFDSSGSLVENRPKIFHYLQKIITGLDSAIQSVRNFVERLNVALQIKTEVFGDLPQYVNYRADVDEIKSKMGSHTHLSVTSTDENGKLIPLGIIHANDLHKPMLGTVTLRDFCNREETKIPFYLEVISVIDHHKSSLQTASPPLAIIADTQSSNVLCAEMAFAINDRFGTGGMDRKQIDAQVAKLKNDLSSSSNKRLMGRLIQKQLAEEGRDPFFIDSAREAVEYMHFLYGILDDTDLLTKVSTRDLECVAKLINRLKSLMLQLDVEVISLDKIPRDKDFIRKASSCILQNADMYSLYRKIYLSKEKAIEQSMIDCAQGKESSFFADTKEQNGCARVGQAKMFASNYSIFSKNADLLKERWYHFVLDFFQEQKQVDLHMQMISTIAGAEDLYAGSEGEYKHQDELWIWIPFTEQSIEHLKGFLSAFSGSPQIQKEGLCIEFHSDKAKDYERIFTESFLPAHKKTIIKKGSLPIAVLKFKAGMINSRKAMISPYLPKLV